MPVNDSAQHVVRTSAQWDERAIEFWVVPRGCLCVELTPDGKTKIKIGEGNKFYSQLPYITSEGDLANYYTKTEIDNLLTNLNRMAIQSTEEYDSKNDLPLTGNKLGDVRFVKSASPSIKADPDVYVWNNTKWIYVGYDFSQIDLSEYVKKEEFEPVKEKVDEMYPLRHTHTNKEILDQIEVAFKVVDKNKLDSLKNYDDTEVKNRLTNVENKAHVHNNLQILNATTASFTIPDKNKLDSLRNYDVFRGTNGIIPGSVGLVPAPQPVDVGKVLGADGRWVDVDVSPFTGATATTDGEEGLVPAPLAGEQSYYLRGDGTWAKVKSGDKYRAGDGIYILAGDILSTTLPVEIYAKDNKLKQYVLYGGENPVGDWDSTLSKYAVVIKVSAEGMSDISTSLFLDDPIGNGDYIDYENQRFVHTRTNMTFSVVSGTYGQWINVDGGILNWHQDSMAPSDYIAVSSEYVYLYYPGDMHGCDQFGIPCYAALYDENKIFTRSILLRSFTEVTIEPQPGEVYMRVSFGYYQGSWYRLTKIGEVITPIVLPPVIIYTNKVNTIDVMTTNKPTEVYFETAVVEDTSEDPMSEYTGIIYNDGVLDITQEDPNALNELTIHFRESDKVITIPAGGGGDSYAEGQGIEFTSNPRSAELPNTYQQIEYLQGTGTQGIILNYTPMSTTPADIKYELTYSDLVSEPTGWHYLIGGWLQSSHKMPPSIVYSNDNYQDKLVLSMCEADIITNGDWPTGNTVHTSIVTIDGSTAKMRLDNGTESSGTWSGSIDHAPAIFASNRGSGTLGSFSAYKFRELKIYENDILIHHYYPCYRKSDNEPGIYDIITNTFLTNNGTGDFICGNDVNYDDTFINAKLGTGLQFDANGAIEVIGGGGGDSYVEGGGIEFIDTTDVDMNFDYAAFVNSLTGAYNGTLTKNVDGSITITPSSSAGSWTVPDISGGSSSPYTFNVAPETTYKLTWDSGDDTVDGSARVFENAALTTMYVAPQYEHELTFTTSNSCSYISIRFEETDSLPMTISNVKLFRLDPSSDVSINAKLGNGLSFDNNDAITVDEMTGASASADGASGAVPAPLIGDETKFLRGDGSWAEIETSTKYVEGDAIEFGHPGMTDLGFDFDTFVSKFTQPNNGTVSIDSANKAFTLTATGFDCYTNPWVSGALYTIPVIGGRKYRLTWNSNASNVDGTVYAFENADTSHMHGVNQADQNYLEFTADTSSNVNFRFGVTNSGNSITFSNIKFYEVDNADPDTNIINVKYGNGLSLDNNNTLQVDGMVGATSQTAGTGGTVPAPSAGDENKFLSGGGIWSNPPTYTLPVATTSTLGGVKVGAGLSMNANDELGVASPYVTSVTNQGSVPGVITVTKSDGISSDVDVLENLRLILNCNYDSSQNQTQLGEPVNAPNAGNSMGSPIIGDLTVLEVT